MRKSDTWPGGVAMESLSNMDSAGSFDSVISMNSGYSEDSMEHLSAEERACLMYLEETIEALEVQEDSGLSNDEPDSVSQAGKMGQMNANDISSFKAESGVDQKSFLSSAVPTPLASLSAEPGSKVLTIQDKAEHHALNETSEPQSSPSSAANMKETSVNLATQVKPPVTESVALSTDEDVTLKVGLDQASEIDLSLIPPPSDFMDEPDPPPQPEKAEDPPPPVGISDNKPGVDLEQLRQRASAKRHSVSPPVTQEPPTKPPELSPLPAHSSAPVSPPEAAEPKSPPAVAPKPKKLPPNIILKSHKAGGADGISGHSVPTTSDRLLLDPRRVHMEALRKLGLLKSDETDASPIPSPKLSPKTRKSWAAPPSPVSPAAPHTPPSTPSDTRVNSPSAASVPLQSPAAVSPTGTSTAPAVLPPVILPAPAAFSDPGGPLLSDDEPSAVSNVSQATVNAQVNTPPLTPPALVKQPTPPKVKGIKSATLERSGMGLSSYMASQDSSEASYGVIGKQSPSELRNSRPRPASLGNGKEFSSTQGAGSQVGHATSKEADIRRSLPAVQHSGDSQKLPRSQGISVLICPRAENGDNRREALKRLGLLRD